MSQLPIKGSTPEEQQRLANQLYVLLGKQVKSYHKCRHMGENSSVPVELAQELMESVEYTLARAGGICATGSIEEVFRVGQDVLDANVQKAKSMFRLVVATAPQWQTECRWEALHCIERYLAAYDHLHLAHRMPEELFYPVHISVPDGIRGIDCCLFFLNMMWLENQIMAGAEDFELEQLWDRLHRDALNQCEQLLINGIGKAVFAPNLDGFVFSENERTELCAALKGKSSEDIRKELEAAAQKLCGWLNLADEKAIAFVNAMLPHMQPRLEGAMIQDNLAGLFL